MQAQTRSCIFRKGRELGKWQQPSKTGSASLVQAAKCRIGTFLLWHGPDTVDVCCRPPLPLIRALKSRLALHWSRQMPVRVLTEACLQAAYGRAWLQRCIVVFCPVVNIALFVWLARLSIWTLQSLATKLFEGQRRIMKERPDLQLLQVAVLCPDQLQVSASSIMKNLAMDRAHVAGSVAPWDQAFWLSVYLGSCPYAFLSLAHQQPPCWSRQLRRYSRE